MIRLDDNHGNILPHPSISVNHGVNLPHPSISVNHGNILPHPSIGVNHGIVPHRMFKRHPSPNYSVYLPDGAQIIDYRSVIVLDTACPLVGYRAGPAPGV